MNTINVTTDVTQATTPDGQAKLVVTLTAGQLKPDVLEVYGDAVTLTSLSHVLDHLAQRNTPEGMMVVGYAIWAEVNGQSVMQYPVRPSHAEASTDLARYAIGPAYQIKPVYAQIG